MTERNIKADTGVKINTYKLNKCKANTEVEWSKSQDNLRLNTYCEYLLREKLF
jgi:hypothetical protein